MGVSFFITTLGVNDCIIDPQYFAECLKTKWPAAKVIFDPKSHSILQWSITTEDGDFILGDFGQNGIVYQRNKSSSDSTLAHWLRKIVPSEYPLFLWKGNLTHEPIEVTEQITEAEIIEGFKVPFDMSKYT